MGAGQDESGTSPTTTFPTVTGYVVGITHGTTASGSLGNNTGIGAMFHNTSTNAMYIRVA